MSERYLTVRDARPRRSGAWTGSPRAVAAKPVMLLVLGMHRSGTSICARGLECLGATASRKLMPPGEDNPKGFFEDAEIFALNEEQLLPRLNRVWNSVAPVDWSCLSDTDRSSAALEAARILRRNFAAAAPLCVLKEPRIGALLPFWLSVLAHCGYEVRVVFAVRDPASVARSLAKRNGMTTAHSSMLFVCYWMSILGCVSGLSAAFVQFDELLADPGRTLEKAAVKLGLTLPADFERRVGIFATEFLEEGLRHHQFNIRDLDLDPEVPPLALELYRQLVKAAQAQSLEPLRRFAATKNKELASIQPFLLDFDNSLLRQKALEAEAYRLDEELGQLQATIKERTNWAQELDNHVKELGGNLGREQKLVEERTAWAHKLETELDQARRALAEATKDAEEKSQWAKNLDREVRDLRALAEERTAWAQTLDREVQALRALAEERSGLEQTLAETRQNRDESAKHAQEMERHAAALQAELDQARSALAEATKDAEEKSQWAKNLDREVRDLRALAEERTAWAQTLDREVQALRALAEERSRLEQTLAETRQNRDESAKHAQEMERHASALEKELGRLRDTLAQQEQTTTERTAWAQKLETELDQARRALAEATKDAEEKSQWAKSLDREIAQLRTLTEERTAWAQKLDREVQDLRAVADERTRLEQTLAETRHAHKQAAKHVEDMERQAAAQETELGRLRDALADQERIVAERTAWAQKLDREIQDLRAVAEERTAWAQAQDREVEQLRAALAEAGEKQKQSSSQSEALREKLFAIESSTVWKLLSPVRAVVNARDALGSALATAKDRPTLEQPDYFDPLWYLSAYPDVACKPSMAFRHFAEIGAAQGKLPNRRFRPEAYEALAQDVAAAGITPALHYLLHGEKEGRCTNWLDRYINDEFGEAARRKTGSLIDLLLAGEGLSASTAYRKEKLRRLVQRFEKAMSASKPSQGKPVASIVIPVYNQLFYTLACAISLFESAPQASFEIIVADDCSTDKTGKVFAKYSPAVKVVRPRTNLGFLRNCNHAARHAQGEIVVMLNNDTVALPGWLDALVETLQARSDCGMAGSKLLNLDGTLQEAGAIYWNDGSAWNFGRGKDPRSYEFAYCKQVDYTSGASIALRREVWEKAGGFDEHFAPAYCEEVDLAFRLREHLGLATVYQPQSVLVHHEGVSHGRDVAVGIKAYQQHNQKKFLERWKSVLERDHFANGQSVFLARDRSRRKPHMLFVDHYVPTPDRDAGSKQMDAYLKLFVRLGIHVTFWPDNLAFDPANTARYQRMGIEVVDTKSGHISFSDWIKDHGRFIDVAFLSRPHISVNYLDALESFAPACRRVYYGHDLHAERLRRELQIAETAEASDELPKMEAWEETCWSKVDFICYPSQEECDHVAAKHPGCKTVVLPLYCVTAADALAARTRKPFGERDGLLFVGGFNHRPNADGVLWFARNVLPLILKESPSVRLTIAGSNPPEEVRDLASIHPGLTITGHVSDEELNNLYEQARVSIAPLRFGAGVKGKVVDSLMRGVPVVTTPVGIQGLAGIGAAISFSDDPARFAALVIELHRNQALWEKQREAGFTYFDDHFTEHAVLQHVRKWLPETAETTSPA